MGYAQATILSFIGGGRSVQSKVVVEVTIKGTRDGPRRDHHAAQCR